MTDITIPKKCMTFGEGGTAIAFAALSISALLIAANAHTPEYAFHAYLSAAASMAVVFRHRQSLLRSARPSCRR